VRSAACGYGLRCPLLCDLQLAITLPSLTQLHLHCTSTHEGRASHVTRHTSYAARRTGAVSRKLAGLGPEPDRASAGGYYKASIRLPPTRTYMRPGIIRVHEAGTTEISRVLQQGSPLLAQTSQLSWCILQNLPRPVPVPVFDYASKGTPICGASVKK
jgi:hypothetical protein